MNEWMNEGVRSTRIAKGAVELNSGLAILGGEAQGGGTTQGPDIDKLIHWCNDKLWIQMFGHLQWGHWRVTWNSRITLWAWILLWSANTRGTSRKSVLASTFFREGGPSWKSLEPQPQPADGVPNTVFLSNMFCGFSGNWITYNPIMCKKEIQYSQTGK